MIRFGKWKEGRQGSGYRKLDLFISQFFLCDLYIIKIPLGVGVPAHTDPGIEGYEHHRVNITVRGFTDQKMMVEGKVHRWWRFEYFRPDLYKHSLDTLRKDMYLLSFGWLRKKSIDAHDSL